LAESREGPDQTAFKELKTERRAVMDVRRRIRIVAIVLLVAGLLITTGWSVMADIVPAPVIVPGGVYSGTLPGPPPFTFTTSVIPLDPLGNRMTFIQRNHNQDPTMLQTEPPASEADHKTDFVGNMVRTGPDTWAYTGVLYGTRKAEGQTQSEILYVEVVQGTTTSTADGNTLTNEGTSAFYLPEQDVDGDGLPDADQVPIYCSPPGAFTITRMAVTPPCVPTPAPEGE
jgi:hypothetical protein